MCLVIVSQKLSCFSLCLLCLCLPLCSTEEAAVSLMMGDCCYVHLRQSLFHSEQALFIFPVQELQPSITLGVLYWICDDSLLMLFFYVGGAESSYGTKKCWVESDNSLPQPAGSASDYTACDTADLCCQGVLLAHVQLAVQAFASKVVPEQTNPRGL